MGLFEGFNGVKSRCSLEPPLLLPDFYLSALLRDASSDRGFRGALMVAQLVARTHLA